MKETCLKLSGTVDAVEEAQPAPDLIDGIILVVYGINDNVLH